MVGVGVADPHVGAHGLDLAAVEEGGPNAKDGVAVANDAAVGKVDRAAEIEGIAGALDVHVADDVLRAGDEEAFSLTVEVVADGEVDQLDAGGVVDGKGTAAGGAGHGRVEGAVVAVADLYLVAVLAAEGQVGLVAEEDKFLVGTVSVEDGDTLRRIVGGEIDGALDSVEVPAAVGCDNDVSAVDGGRSGFGGEGPGAVGGEACEVARDGDEHARADLHDIFVMVVQDIVVGIDGRHVVVEKHWIEVEVGQAADGSELVLVQVRGRRPDGWRSGGGRRRDGRVCSRRLRGRGGDAVGRVRAGGDTEVESIDEVV